MASFDFVKASLDGLRFAWRQRADLVKFAFPVIFVGVFCNLLIIYSGVGEDILRAGLVQIPALFAQGYFFSELVRYALFGEAFVYWGYTRRSRIEGYVEVYRERQLDLWRKKCVQGGMIVYVLFTLVSSAFLGFLRFYNGPEPVPEGQAAARSLELADMPVFILESAIILLGIMGMLWVVRLGFAYIPLAAGYSAKSYLKGIRGLYSSVPLFLCSVIVAFMILAPFLLLLMFFGGLFAEALGPRIVAFVILLEFYKIAVLSVTTIACAYGIRDMLGGLPRQGGGADL